MRTDCRFFRGQKPCQPNKLEGQECHQCPHYERIAHRILIIKLDAIGDVLRTTFLLPLIHQKWPKSFIVWITLPDSVELFENNNLVDQIWTPSSFMVSRLLTREWDAVICPSNDHNSAALATITKSKKTYGYQLDPTGKLIPHSAAAACWMEMGVFDRVKRENTESYQSIMVRMIGTEIELEDIPRPIYNVDENANKAVLQLMDTRGLKSDRGFIGINVGSGSRWPKKMLAAAQIIQLFELLSDRFPEKQVCLLGGPKEKDKIEKISRMCSKAIIFDTARSIHLFGALIDMLDVLVTGDTLALHMAVALDIPVVAVFGPTSFAEIYDYGGQVQKIIPKNLKCLGCYSDCHKSDNCMRRIPLPDIVEAVGRQMKG